MCRVNKGYWIAISGITLCISVSLSLYAYYFYYEHLQMEVDLPGHDTSAYPRPTPPPDHTDSKSSALGNVPGDGKAVPVTSGKEKSLADGQEVKPSSAPGPKSKKAPSLLQFLLDDYKANRGNVPKEVEILKKLEELSARYENGRNLFTQTDALETVLLPGLDSEVVDIRRGSCNVFAVAAQNNAIVQSKAVHGGVLPYLIRLLKYDPVVRPRALYALTSILRNYPDAEKKFIQEGGIHQIVLIGYLPETKIRSLHFLTDLITERKLCRKEPPTKKKLPWEDNVETESDDPCDKDDLLGKALKEAGWWKLLCHSVRYLTGDTSEEMTVIEAVHASRDLCGKELGHLRSSFENLLTKYEKDPDFKDTRKQLSDILNSLSEDFIGKKSSGVKLRISVSILLIWVIVFLKL